MRYGILTKTIGILHPIPSLRCLRARRIRVYVVKYHVGPVDDINAPQLGLNNVKVLHRHIGHIPEDKWHGTAGTGGAWSHGRVSSFSVVPELAVAIDATSAITINADVFARQNEASGMVLELDVVRIVAPVVQVLGEQPLALPVDCYVVYNGIKTTVDVICVTSRKYYIATIVAVLKRFQNGRHVVCCIRLTRVHSTRRAPIAATMGYALATSNG